MTPSAKPAGNSHPLVVATVALLAVVVLIIGLLLFALLCLVTYGWALFLTVNLGVAVVAFFGLDRLLRLSPSSSTTIQEQWKWRNAILGSLAGILVYGFALDFMVEHVPLPQASGNAYFLSPFFDRACDWFVAACIDLLLVMALAVGFGHGFIVGWRFSAAAPANPAPPPLPDAPGPRLTPRQRQLVFTVLWTAPTAALYALTLLSTALIVWNFVPHARPNFEFRGLWEVQQRAIPIGAATVLLAIIATLLWHIWRGGLLPFDILQSARATRPTTRMRNALVRFCKARNT